MNWRPYKIYSNLDEDIHNVRLHLAVLLNWKTSYYTKCHVADDWYSRMNLKQNQREENKDKLKITCKTWHEYQIVCDVKKKMIYLF